MSRGRWSQINSSYSSLRNISSTCYLMYCVQPAWLAVSPTCIFMNTMAILISTRTCMILMLVALSLNTRVAVSDPGACGPGNGGYQCSAPDGCCSNGNYCGHTDLYCGNGCQTAFSAVGACKTGAPSPLSAGTRCGTVASNAKCQGNMCCSQHGYCGNEDSFCFAGCQSQCRLKPGTIAGIVFGALGGFAISCAVAYGLFRLYRGHKRRKPYVPDSIDPVHRLFPIDDADDEATHLDIVFCHGFGIGELEREAWRKTWLVHGDSTERVCWAKDWLGSDMNGQARVFSLEYDGNVSLDPSRMATNTDVSEIARNLLQCIFGESYNIGQSNTVVLVGHSFGGLVIKSLVVEAQHLANQPQTNAVARDHARKCQHFLNNMGGFIFYAVPHSGAQKLELYIDKCNKLYRRWHRRGQPLELLANIREFSRSMEELSVKFEAIVRSPNNGVRYDDLIIYAFTEGSPMTQEGLGVIVEHGSAARLSGTNHYKIEAANHMNVCQPFAKNDESYRQLLRVLNIIVQNAPMKHAHVPDDLEEGFHQSKGVELTSQKSKLLHKSTSETRARGIKQC